MYIRRASPSAACSPHTNVTWSPGLSSAMSSTSLPIRSLGPGRSCMIATGSPARFAASRTRDAVSACSSAVPCEKFSRATSMPASIMRTSTSGSREAGPIVATIFVRRMARREGSGQARGTPSCWITSPSALRRPPARRSQIMSQCTADSFVAAGLGIGAAERQVDGAADLLVEQDRPGRPVDAGVRADPDLAQQAGARVGVQRRQQVLLRRARRARPPRGPSRNSSSIPATSTPRGLDGIVKRIRPSAESSTRAGEDLARRHVALAVGVDPGAAGDAEPQVGALGLDAQLARPAQPLDQARPGARAARPRRPPGRRGPGTSRGGRSRRTRPCPCRPAGRRRESARASRTSAAASRPRGSAPARAPRAPSAPGRRRPARSCSRAPGS